MATQEGIFIVGDSQGVAYRSGWPWHLVYNATVKNLAEGSTTLVTDMEPVYDVNCAATSTTDYQYAVIQGGVNDISGGDTLVDIQAAITSMAGIANGYGFDLYVMGVAPWKNASGWDAAKQTITDNFNSWLAAQAGALGYTYIDVYTPLEDGTNADELSASYDIGDNLHLNPAGYRVWAQQLEAEITLNQRTPSGVDSFRWRGSVEPAESGASGNQYRAWRGGVEPVGASTTALRHKNPALRHNDLTLRHNDQTFN